LLIFLVRLCLLVEPPLKFGLLLPVVFLFHQASPEETSPVLTAAAGILKIESKVSENKNK
jgi:hypothetical protein